MQPSTPTSQFWFHRIIFVAGVGIILRVIVAFGVLHAMPQAEDGPSYSAEALRMLDGSVGYYYFPPGTSFFAVPVYALFGQSTLTDHLLGVVLTSGFLIAGIWFCGVVLGWGKATFVGALLLALYPHSVMSATQLNSEPLTTILLTCAAGLAILNAKQWSWARWVGVSVCLAGAILTRPASLAVLVVLGASGLVLWKQGRISLKVIAGAAAILILTLSVSVYPIMAHNARMEQGWAISTNNEFNLFLANSPYTPDYKTGHFGQRKFDELPPDARAYMSSVLPHEEPYLATSDQRIAMRQAAIEYMTKHPGRTLYRISNRARAFWGMDYTAARTIQDAYGLSNAAFLPLLAVEGGGYLIVVILALAAPFLVPSQLRSHWKIIIGFVGAVMLPYLLAFALPKYHLPAIPLLMPIAALACVSIVEDPGGSWLILRRSALWWIVVAALFALQAEHLVQLILLR